MRCISGQCGSRNGNAPVIEGEQSANIGRYPIFANRNTLTPREASKTLAAAVQVHARCFPGFPAKRSTARAFPAAVRPAVPGNP
mgnify:CR=1 FL=1